MNYVMAELTCNPPQENKSNKARKSENQIPTLLLLESSLYEIHKARELDRARRHRVYMRCHNFAPLACPESAVVAVSSSCRTAVQDGDTSTTEQFKTIAAVGEPTSNVRLFDVAEHSTEVEGQLRQTPTHFDTTKVNKVEKVTMAHRKTTDRDILAKAVQARMVSKSKSHGKNKTREEASPVSGDTKPSPKTGSNIKAFDGTLDHKSVFVSTSLSWICDLCRKRNSGDKTRCEVCGRNRGFRLPALAQTNSKCSAPIKQASTRSSSKTIPSTMNSALSTITTNRSISSNALRRNSMVSKNNAKETIRSYFLKHKVDFEMHARQALADDVSSTLSYIRASAHSNKKKQT
jgi:hypothetical protein